MKYIKRPVPVEAYLWKGEAFAPSHVPPGKIHSVYGTLHGGMLGTLETSEGPVQIRSDWHYIVGPGAGGEFWPVRKDIFEATYYRAYEEGYDRDRDNPLPSTVRAPQS